MPIGKYVNKDNILEMLAIIGVLSLGMFFAVASSLSGRLRDAPTRHSQPQITAQASPTTSATQQITISPTISPADERELNDIKRFLQEPENALYKWARCVNYQPGRATFVTGGYEGKTVFSVTSANGTMKIKSLAEFGGGVYGEPYYHLPSYVVRANDDNYLDLVIQRVELRGNEPPYTELLFVDGYDGKILFTRPGETAFKYFTRGNIPDFSRFGIRNGNEC
ncbi:MAG: hypothetical protein HYT70_01540 [Candidatus Aenigmarchaeota archaeon]|nr:hypothetical protein [Candidatus Aenigmarchaeota archaeon]